MCKSHHALPAYQKDAQGGHARDSMELRLQQGVLLRVITDACAWCSHVLTTLAGCGSKLAPGESWGDSVAGNLLKIHEKELGLRRSTGACYREMKNLSSRLRGNLAKLQCHLDG